ncbi:MAG: GNAT family N-acetyltransferase [Pseudomonadota bacterium]
MPISVDRIHTFKDIEAHWRALFHRSSNANFFISPAWMSAWLAEGGGAAELWCIRYESAGQVELIGIFGAARIGAPLISVQESRLHGLCDPALDAIYIEYNDFLIADQNNARRIEAIHAAINALSQCDQFVFQNITDVLAADIKAVASDLGLTVRELVRQPTYQCDLKTLRQGQTDLVSSLSKSLRHKVQRSQRLYEERGPLDFALAETTAARQTAFSRLIALHQAGWRRRGVDGAFSNPAFVAFHERLIRGAPEQTHLIEIRAGGETIGVLYNFIFGNRVSAYQSGFRFEDDNRLAPGYLSHALACEYYLAAGFDVYDFLGGDAEHKRRLGLVGPALSTVCVERRNPKMRLRSVGRKIKQQILGKNAVY